jgi:imidazolonepropionase-like amidohydrolase
VEENQMKFNQTAIMSFLLLCIIFSFTGSSVALAHPSGVEPKATLVINNVNVIEGTDPRSGQYPVNQKLKEGWMLQYEVNKQFMPPKDQLKEMNTNLWQTVKKMVKLASDMGVKIMSGTDAGYLGVYPGISTHSEMASMVEAGMSPLQALKSATLSPVQYFNLEDDLGNISPGMEASFLLIEGNPLEDISNTLNIIGISLKGKFNRPEDFKIIVE